MLIDMLTTTAAKHGGPQLPAPHRSPSPATTGSYFSQMPLSMLSSVLRKPGAAREPSPVDSPSSHKPSVTPDHTAAASSPTASRPHSSSSVATNDEKPKKKAPRSKTTYRLAQPPSAARPKLHFRPKVLLQLHQVVASGRPKPVYEVIPFSLLAPRSTRRLARTFSSKSRDKLSPNDLLIVKAEEYGTPDEDSKSDDERWGGREVIGIICPAKEEKDATIKTEVLMNDGACWEVTNLPNGGYEFGCTDEHGLSLKSRWVPKAVSRRTSGISASASTSSPIVEERKFNFSTISANSRRHPVIANMTRTNIEVLDAYAMPSATSPPTPGYPPSGLTSPLPTPASINASSFLDSSNERLTVKTDDTLRRFIVLSGIWVAFSEGWSPLASLSKSIGPPPLITSTTFRPAPPGRSMSYIDSPRSASPASTIDENRRVIPRMFRTGTQRLRAVSSQSISTPTSTQTSPSSSPRITNRSRRSNSTGNADLGSKTGSTRKKFGLALEDQALQETEEERQIKRSTEINRIKELVLPNSPSANSSPRLVESPLGISTSPPAPTNPNAARAQSTYNPVTTAGLWDSGVTEHPGLKARPTSLVILNGKKEKARRKQEKENLKEKRKSLDVDSDGTRKVGRFKQCLNGIFRRGKN